MKVNNRRKRAENRKKKAENCKKIQEKFDLAIEKKNNTQQTEMIADCEGYTFSNCYTYFWWWNYSHLPLNDG